MHTCLIGYKRRGIAAVIGHGLMWSSIVPMLPASMVSSMSCLSPFFESGGSVLSCHYTAHIMYLEALFKEGESPHCALATIYKKIPTQQPTVSTQPYHEIYTRLKVDILLLRSDTQDKQWIVPSAVSAMWPRRRSAKNAGQKCPKLFKQGALFNEYVGLWLYVFPD